MALQVGVTLASDLTVPAAYVRVTDLSVFKDEIANKFYLSFGVEIHATAQARADKKRIVDSTRYKCEYDNTKEVYAQAYTYLKNLYPGAKDV